MRPGRASRTAEMVCMGRATAHAVKRVGRFSDPTALTLLPEPARQRVLKVIATPRGGALRTRVDRLYLSRQSAMMAIRTLAIDDALRAHPTPQVVILGAGLDGRAWRMAELAGCTVFEVDHPDSQADKRARSDPLPRVCQDIRFVPVDFTRDNLDERLAAAGHDPLLPTAWVWEGVVMYLTPEQTSATLEIIDRRSSPGSRLVVVYHQRSLSRRLVGLLVGLMGEPLRSWYAPEEMRQLLSRFHLAVTRDANIPELAQALAPELINILGMVRHLRIAVADR